MHAWFLAFFVTRLALAKVVEQTWDISWINAAPDGFERPVIAVNGQWPCPELRASVGDRVIVHVNNNLGNQSTAIHWHGIHQKGSPHMDGGSLVHQCPIAPGHSFTYDWTADSPGTYWYHSHNSAQYPDGLWGPLIIEDPNPPFHYDEEMTVTLSDWYHEEAANLVAVYQSKEGAQGSYDGVPNPSGGVLINSGKNVSIHVKPDTTYLVRIICPGSYPGHAWKFDGHNQTTVEIDGVYTKAVDVNDKDKLTRIAPGQRQAVLIHTHKETDKNYAIWDIMDLNMLFINKGVVPPPATYNANGTAWFVYNESAPLPDPPVFRGLTNARFWDDCDYEPLDGTPLLAPVDRQIVLDVDSAIINGIARYTINGETHLNPKVPSLYTALTVGEYATNSTVYGRTGPIILQKNEIIELVINNHHNNLHPFHLHGRQFQLLDRPDPDYGIFNGTYRPGYPRPSPALRDTIMLQPRSWAVIRFRADNPGVWPLHCHVEMHVNSGFVATFIEAPEELQAMGVVIPEDHLDACKALPMPYAGNAAGNVENPLDVTGMVTEVPDVDHGSMFESKV